MVKASAGGGGKGIRIVRREEDLEKAYESAKSETKAAFGDDTMYMEKVIENARHIEIQILGDEFGHVIHLGERDCSIQRRNQKCLRKRLLPPLTRMYAMLWAKRLLRRLKPLDMKAPVR